MTEPPPPPYQETDPNSQPPPYQENAPPNYEEPNQQTYEQQDYGQPQQDYGQTQQEYGQPQPNYGQPPPQPTQTYDPQPTGGNDNEPEDVVATSGSSDSKSQWSFGSMEDGDGFFGSRKLRLITMGTLLTLFSFLAFPFWFGTEESIFGGLKLSDVDKAFNTSFEDGWNLHAAGLFFMFLAFIACLVLVFLDWRGIFNENKFVNLVASAVMWLGAFLYWVGGMTVAGSFNDWKKDDGAPDSQTAFAGVFFGEATFIFLLGVSLGLDIFINIQSKSKRVRIYLINAIIILVASLILFFSYASMDEKDFKQDKDTYSAYNTIAAGWFFVLIGIILLGVLEFLLHSNSFVQANNAMVWNGTIGFFLFGAFLTAIGYWAACDQKPLRKGDKDAKTANSNLNAYFVGMSFVVLTYCVIEAIDIKLYEYLPFGKKDSSSNSNQQADSDNVVYDPPTTEP